MSKQTALFIDGPAAGRRLEVPSHRYDITVAMATLASRPIKADPHRDEGPLGEPLEVEKVTYYRARTHDLPFGYVFYSLDPLDSQGWTRGIKMLELAATSDREEFEKALNTRMALAEKRVADMADEVSKFRWTMSKLTGALTLAMGGLGEDE